MSVRRQCVELSRLACEVDEIVIKLGTEPLTDADGLWLSGCLAHLGIAYGALDDLVRQVSCLDWNFRDGEGYSPRPGPLPTPTLDRFEALRQPLDDPQLREAA